MRKVLTKVKRCLAVCLCLALFMTTSQVTAAQENADSDIMQEYLEKMATGVDIYPLVDEEGVMYGYYEPYSEDDMKAVMPRYGSSIEWTIGSNQYTKGVNIYTLAAGKIIYVAIGFSEEGRSRLGLYNRATDEPIIFPATEVTNGWSGKITLGENVTTSTYSFAIFNYSDHTITYTGSYSL